MRPAGFPLQEIRPSKNSPWRRLKPIDFEIFVADVLQREEAWRRKFALDDIYAHVQPGRGHCALANLVARSKISGIITQNIDNLHQASGVAAESIVELHGNGTYATCLACGKRHELAAIRRAFDATGAAPICADCSGIVKAATLSFGQPVPEAAMRRAHELATGCDLLLAIGSSLVVYPAAAFPTIARQHGARLEHVPEKLTDFSDILDIGYTRCLITDMLYFFDVEPICRDHVDRNSSTSDISDVPKSRFRMIRIGSSDSQ